MQWGNHHHNLISEHLCPSRRNPVLISSQLPLLPFALQPSATTNSLSISINLSILDTSYKWIHIICGLSCLSCLLSLSIMVPSPAARVSISFLLIAE